MGKKIIVCEYCGRIMIDPELAGVTGEWNSDGNRRDAQLCVSILIFPPSQPLHSACKEPRHKFVLPALGHHFPAMFLEFFYVVGLKREITFLITIAAIQRVNAPVSIRSSAVWVFAHRHSATLTKFIFCFHSLLKCIFSKCYLFCLAKTWK